MTFSSYEELAAAVEKRRAEILTLEVDLGSDYSPEYEQAKAELAQAKAMKTVAGAFLGDQTAGLEARVAQLKPESQTVWIQFSKLSLGEWRTLLKQAGADSWDQYERVLPKTFKGLYGADPVKPDDWDETHEGEEWVKPEPLTLDARSVSSKGDDGILPGGSLHGVVQNFIAWQNSGGDVSIRPTKSGRD